MTTALPLAWVQQEHQSSSSLPVKIETAYDIIFQPTNKLTFDIAQIDGCLELTDRGGGSFCVITSNSSLHHLSNILLTRLGVRALLSKCQGGFESSSVIFIDAGNCSDIYQTVNFARQYGLDVQKVLDSIIVSRPFNIHQLAGLIINELDSAVITQRIGAKLLVISDLLKMFVQDPQIDPDEARWLVREIARSLRKLSRQVLIVVSMNECLPQYGRSPPMSLIDKQIRIARTAKEPNRLQVKLNCSNSNLHYVNRGERLSTSSYIMTERGINIVPAH
jgi:hypothetical protein